VSGFSRENRKQQKWREENNGILGFRVFEASGIKRPDWDYLLGLGYSYRKKDSFSVLSGQTQPQTADSKHFISGDL
jgi:hypothetical protein